MRVLVLGGTWFLGRAIVLTALERGHDVTTFNRGRTGADVEGVRAVRGDRTRTDDLAHAAAAGPYDVIVDPSGYVPADVTAGAHALAGAARRYVFVSTVDAYEGWPTEPTDESSALHECPPDAGWQELPYGHLKAGCEHSLQQAWPGKLTVVRPGIVLGPREPKGRLPWWLRRMERGGQVLAPGYPHRHLQLIDVRDAAEFTIDLAEQDRPVTVNLTSPPGHTTMGEFLGLCAEVTGGHADLVWVPDHVLATAGINEWTELPMWRPAPGTWAVNTDLAQRLGLRCRPITETVRDTWQWMRSGETVADHWRTAEHGIDPDKEESVLSAWLAGEPTGEQQS